MKFEAPKYFLTIFLCCCSGRVYVNNTQYSILVVKHIQPEDEGDYTCEATHTQTAQVNSETIAVAVQCKNRSKLISYMNIY